MSDTVKRTIKYETQACTRCGGGGQYSYCQMHGSTCFKCGGTGKQLTRRGAKARQAIEAFKATVLTQVPAGQLVAGQRVKLSPTDSFRRVISVQPTSGGQVVNGTVIPSVMVETQKIAYGMPVATLVTLAPTAEQLDVIYAYVATLKSGVTIVTE
jgi:hypothetical protein